MAPSISSGHALPETPPLHGTHTHPLDAKAQDAVKRFAPRPQALTGNSTSAPKSTLSPRRDKPDPYTQLQWLWVPHSQ